MPANWRNDGSGIWNGVDPPTKWSEKGGILWKTNVGKSSNSSLIKVGKRIFVANEKALLQCLDVDTGKILWQHELKKESLPEDQQQKVAEGNVDSGNASHTPVSDGKFVYVAFANSIVAAFDLTGRRKWATALGERTSSDGRSSSPLLVDGKLLWLCGHLYALDCATGKILWESKEVGESFGTPITIKMGGKPAVVTPNGFVVRATDGKILGEEMGDISCPSPIRLGRMVYWVGDAVYAYKIPDKDEPFQVDETWVDTLDGEIYASAIIHDKIIYSVANNAVFYAIDAATGSLIYEKPLPIAPNNEAQRDASVYSSVSLAGNRIYVCNTAGETVIIKPGKKYKKISVNRLAEGSAATPVFSGNRIYTRSGKSVICIEK